MKKSKIILRLYDTVGRGEMLDLNDCCEKLGISVATFRRYIALLRDYFQDIHGERLIYDGRRRVYRLDRVQPTGETRSS